MGTVYRRGRRLWLGFKGPHGEWVYRSSGYRVGQELLAEKTLREIEERVRAGRGGGTELTLEQFGRRWAVGRVTRGAWTNAKLDAKALENHLFGAELEVAGRRVAMGQLLLGDVRELHVRAWLELLEAKGLAGRTRSSLYSLMNRIFKRAVRDELVLRNPCVLERGELPRQVDKDPAWRGTARFTLRELEQLISAPAVPLDRRVFYAVGFLGGLRCGEIAALRWKSVELGRRPLGRFSVGASFTRKNKREKAPKSGRPREVPVHPVTAKLLQVWRSKGWARLFGRAPGADDLVVPNRLGTYVTDLNVTENWAHDLKALGLRHRRFHDTKRTFVTLAREGGATPLLRWVTHGPTAREMLDTYASPDWKALCREVARVKARLRTGKLVQGFPTKVPTGGRSTMRSTEEDSKTASAQGEIRTRPGPLARQNGDENSRASLRLIRTEGPGSSPDRSKSTTARRPVPFRGGMAIEG